MTLNLSYTSELMTNYLQAEWISPQKRFEALQTVDGSAALFAIDTSGVLNVIAEQSGETAAGWAVTDLSSAQIARDFPAGGTVSALEAGQSGADGTFGLAMVVTSGSANHLYLSLGNSSKDLSWTAAPNWTAYPYDDPAIALPELDVVAVYFCEPSGTTQYILVDVVRDPSSPVKDVARFLIDPTRASGHAWNSHDLPIDVEVGSYTSAVGRPQNGYVDGVYTAGTAGSSGQLVYLPIKNVFGSGPPLPARLQLPAGVLPTAEATMRNLDLSTDLFVVGGSALYYFASSNQRDGAQPVALLENEIFSGSTQLVSMLYAGTVTLWGRNASDQVYSLSCALSSVASASAWSVPVPILSGVEQMSAYVNAADGGNTIFAAGSGAAERVSRSAANGLWVTDRITLPVPPRQPSVSFSSYTTSIQVNGDDGLPAANASISLSANRRTGVYVNGTYYCLDTVPVHVATRPNGTITIVEATQTLTGTTFTVSAGTGSGVTVNPMDGPFRKLAQLNTPDALTQATITNADGTTRPLVPAGASADDLTLVASGLGQLSKSYGLFSQGPQAHQLMARGAAAFAVPAGPSGAASVGDALGGVEVAVGDLFNWLASGIEADVKIIEDTLNDVLLFVAEIAGEAYTAVIDSVEAVVGAAVWLFDRIKTAVEDLIEYVEFLFEWDDIKRTKDVFHNLIKQYLVGQVDQLEGFKSEFDSVMGGLQQTVASWAGITDWSRLGEAAGKPAAGSASDPMQGQNAASQHLNHHFQNNAANISPTGDLPVPDVLENLVDELISALTDEATVLDGVITQLRELASEFSSLSVDQVLCRLVGILAEGVLGSAQVVIDVILDILIAVAATAVLLLDTDIYIPVVSDILEAIGVPSLSFLDLFCWVAAVGYTVVYKIAKGTAPFPDGATTTFLASASIGELQQAFANPTPRLAAVAAPGVAPAAQAAGLIPIPSSVAEIVFVAGHGLGGFFTLMSDFISTFEAAEEVGDNPFSTPSAVLGALSGGCVGITNVLVPRDPVQNKIVSTASTVTTLVRLIAKGVFSGPAQSKFKTSTNIMKNLLVNDGRATGAIVDAILVIPALACTGWHFYEIGEQAASTERSDAILEEVSNLTSYISRVAYAVAVNDDDPESRAIEIGVMAVANLATAGLQTAEAVVG